ncbi:uncharacterized protein BXIN_2396 [Babesia sp. Xinjiang]|uniref:uncharacterized protein n=1 Tax=Babesia sp. Xinjiang TaxID=462227 RepID=UPI000A233EE6|nr:uncharacterized protein BXIN_2396 [Babesia sp. Xinjiang]ORM40647.1 hypothetical protein BXIN_2396 [Babesia sp. Xinjiang]
MSRIFVKQVPKLVRQHLPRVPQLGAVAVVEALEDVACLRERDKHVEEFITHCVSRALALLPDLRVPGVIRALFAYKKADVHSQVFLEEVAKFILEECGHGRLYESFLENCTANDILLLYKAFAVNEYFNIQLYTLCMGLIATQTPHMIPSDCVIFFQSHLKYLRAFETGGFAKYSDTAMQHRVMNAPLATEITLQFLKQKDATPEDLTSFAEWLVPMGEYYGICDAICDLVAQLHLNLSQKPVIFSIDHIHRLVQSTCKLHAHTDTRYHRAARTFIESLLHEAERRSDVHKYEDALASLYALDSVDLWRLELVSGLLYSVINNVDCSEDAARIRKIIKRMLQSTDVTQKTIDSMTIEFTIDICPSELAVLRLREMLDLLDKRKYSAIT